MYKTLRERKPIVHCITNYVTVNDVANTILAVGAAPIMADDISEIEEIVNISNALVLNIGTLNERTIHSMIEAGKYASKKGIPVILDPVGCGVTNLRTDAVKQILDKVNVTVIKGNMSEIYSLAHNTKNTSGVDVSAELDLKDKTKVLEYLENIKQLSVELNSVIAVTGAIDIVTNGVTSYLVHNGVAKLGEITGTGCMTAGLIAAFVSSSTDTCFATAKAISLMGQAGEHAGKHYKGLGQFKVDIFNGLSMISAEDLIGDENIETV